MQIRTFVYVHLLSVFLAGVNDFKQFHDKELKIKSTTVADPYVIILHCNTQYSAVQYTTLYCTILHKTKQYYAMLQVRTQYYAVLCYTALYYTI